MSYCSLCLQIILKSNSETTIVCNLFCVKSKFVYIQSRQKATLRMGGYSDSGKSFKMRLVIWRGDSFLPLAIQDWQRPKKA